MPIITGKEILRPYLKIASGYIKSLLPAQHVEMDNGKSLQISIDEINQNFTNNPIKESGLYNGQSYYASKFSNGEMILRQRLRLLVTAPNQWGTLWESPKISYGNFAVPFSSTPRVWGINVGDTGFFIETIMETTANSIGVGYLVRPSQLTAAYNVFIDILAIGEWK